MTPIIFVVVPATMVMGFTFPASSTLLGDDPREIAANAGRAARVQHARLRSPRPS